MSKIENEGGGFKALLAPILIVAVIVAVSFASIAVDESDAGLSDKVSGECGDDVMWRWDVNAKTLTITGSGPMYDYDRTPWTRSAVTANGYNFTKVVFLGNVTHVGDNAFNNTYVSQVEFCDSIESIGHSAFKFSLLKSVVIPDSVTTIGHSAFFGCNDLRSVSVPDTLEIIPGEAFTGAKISSFDFPSALVSIEGRAFEGCPINPDFTGCTSLSKIAGFKGTKLTNLDVPDSVETVDVGGWTQLKTLNLGKNVSKVTIGEWGGTNNTSLVEMSVDPANEHYMVVDGVLYTYDGTELTYYPVTKGDTVLNIPEGVQKVSSISNNKLQVLNIPGSVTEFRGLGASNLQALCVPPSIDKLNFRDIEGLDILVIPTDFQFSGMLDDGTLIKYQSRSIEDVSVQPSGKGYDLTVDIKDGYEVRSIRLGTEYQASDILDSPNYTFTIPVEASYYSKVYLTVDSDIDDDVLDEYEPEGPSLLDKIKQAGFGALVIVALIVFFIGFSGTYIVIRLR